MTHAHMCTCAQSAPPFRRALKVIANCKPPSFERVVLSSAEARRSSRTKQPVEPAGLRSPSWTRSAMRLRQGTRSHGFKGARAEHGRNRPQICPRPALAHCRVVAIVTRSETRRCFEYDAGQHSVDISVLKPTAPNLKQARRLACTHVLMLTGAPL